MRIADYTTRANYQENYRKANRDAINARKREWRNERKLSGVGVTRSREAVEAERRQDQAKL